MSIHDLMKGVDARRVRLSPEALVFVTERHLATLTTLRPDGSPHVVPIAFTWDDERGVAIVTTNRTSFKARNLVRQNSAFGQNRAFGQNSDSGQNSGAGQPSDSGQPSQAVASRAVLCQVDGGRWLTLEGIARVVTTPETVRDAEVRYARRYRTPRENPNRVVIEILVDKVLGSAYMVDG